MPGQVGQVIAQKYTLVKLVGRGGMGSVWRAHHGALDSPVAIKLLSAEASPELSARFRREAQAAARLRSPNVVQIFDCGVEGKTPFIVMELLEGEDLGQRLRRVGRLDRESAYRIVIGIKRVLQRAHAVGIVHRDLKPANLFLCAHDDIEILKILDFGIAKSLFEQGLTLPGMMLGTPGYSSPEQCLGLEGVDHRADLWSLAVIVYRMLTGNLPFPGRNAVESLQASMRGVFRPPSEVDPTLGPAVDAFFARAFARSVDDRFSDANSLANSLAAALELDVRSSSSSLEWAVPSGEPGLADGAGPRISPVSADSPAPLSPAPLSPVASVPAGAIEPTRVEGGGAAAPRRSPAPADAGGEGGALEAPVVRIPEAEPPVSRSTIILAVIALAVLLAALTILIFLDPEAAG